MTPDTLFDCAGRASVVGRLPVPCLAATWMAGPAGLRMFLPLSAITLRRARPAGVVR